MNSPGHRENLLFPEWDDIGIGVVLDKKGRTAYFTQCFGRRGSRWGFWPESHTPSRYHCDSARTSPTASSHKASSPPSRPLL